MSVTNEQAKAFSICKLDCEECKANEVCYDFTSQETCGKLGVALLEARELINEMREVIEAYAHGMKYDMNAIRVKSDALLEKSKEFAE